MSLNNDGFSFVETSDYFIIDADKTSDSYKMWQGLIGPYYTPSVDAEGNISWANNGGLPNPPTQNIRGEPGMGLTIKGIVDTVGDLPQGASDNDVYLVGTDAPYEGYLYTNNQWVDIGEVGLGIPGRGISSITKTSSSGTNPVIDTYTITYTDSTTSTFLVTNGVKGDTGTAAGFGTPTATIDANTGTPSVTVTASGSSTAKVFAFAFHNLKGAKGDTGQGVPASGSTGQVLAKKTDTDYDTEWRTPLSLGDDAPAMDGTASAGSATTAARSDHVHPLYNQFVRPNLLDNWYFVGGGSQLGYGVFPINQRGQTSYTGNATRTLDRWTLRGSATLSVASNGITVGADNAFHGIIQSVTNGVDNLKGKTVTLSALISAVTGSGNGVIQLSNGASANVIGTSIATKSFSDVGLVTLTTTIPSNLSNAYFNVSVNATDTNNFGFTVQAIKLELGSTQTVAHQENGTWVLNEVPNYHTELAKCQAYLYPFSFAAFCLGTTGASHTNPVFYVPTPVPMAKNPTTQNSITVNIQYATGYVNTVVLTVTQCNADDGGVRITTTGTTPIGNDDYAMCQVQLRQQANPTIYLSAEP